MERSVRRRSVPRPPTPLQPQPDKAADACAGERGYREKVLAIDFPASEREGFVRGFERSFATNVAEGKALSAEFIRVERDISKTILTITNLVEMERNRVKLGTDGQTLLFEDNETKDQFSMLVGRLTQLGTEEDKIISKGNDAVRKSSENLRAAADSFR